MLGLHEVTKLVPMYQCSPTVRPCAGWVCSSMAVQQYFDQRGFVHIYYWTKLTFCISKNDTKAAALDEKNKTKNIAAINTQVQMQSALRSSSPFSTTKSQLNQRHIAMQQQYYIICLDFLSYLTTVFCCQLTCKMDH